MSVVVVMHPDAGLFRHDTDLAHRPKCGIIVDDAVMRMSREKVTAAVDVTLQLLQVGECRESAMRLIDDTAGARTWRGGRCACAAVPGVLAATTPLPTAASLTPPLSLWPAYLQPRRAGSVDGGGVERAVPQREQ